MIKTLILEHKNEEESTSLESKEKNEEVEIIPKMTPRAYVQEKLASEDIPYILEVEEVIIPLIDSRRPPS